MHYSFLLKYTLNGQIIMTIPSVLCWATFCLKYCAILFGIDSLRCWKVMQGIWHHAWWIALSGSVRFDGCGTSCLMALLNSSNKCSIGLRSGDCGGHLSKVKSPSCSWNLSCTIWALWHGALSYWKKPSPLGYAIHITGWTWSIMILRYGIQTLFHTN